MRPWTLLVLVLPLLMAACPAPTPTPTPTPPPPTPTPTLMVSPTPEETPALTPSPEQTPTVAVTGTPTPEGTPTPGGTPEAAAQRVILEVRADDLSPDTVSLRAGEAELVVFNRGAAPHAVRLEGDALTVQTEPIPSGQTEVLRVNLQSGTYRLLLLAQDGRPLPGAETTISVA